MLSRPRVLLIGWDGADWQHIHPLLDSGAMPNLQNVIANGVMGDLAPLTPFCSPLLWTSMSTGQYADRHGILDWAEEDLQTGGVRAITRRSLIEKHVWELLADQGLTVQSIGWPVTHPASEGHTCVSDQFAAGGQDSVSPEREEALLPLRFSPAEWSGADLQLFVPQLDTIDQDRDKRLAKLAVLLAHDASNHAAATALLETNEADFTAVWYGAAARTAEIFPADTDAVYADVMAGVYRYLDLLLGRLLHLAGPDAIVLLASDRAANGKLFSTGRESQGILCARGPGVQADELAHGAGALDLAPTVLALFGFRQLPEMPGHVIEEICSQTPLEELKRPATAATPSDNTEPVSAVDFNELEELGYKDLIGESTAPELLRSNARRTSNLVQVLLAQGRLAEAAPILESIVRSHPQNSEAKLHLAQVYLQMDRVAEARLLAEELMEKHPDSPLAPIAKAQLAIAEGDVSAADHYLAEGRGRYGLSDVLDVAIGRTYLRLERWDEAAAAFHSALAVNPQSVDAIGNLAKALLGAERNEEAAEAALDAIRLRYNQPEAHDTLGRALQALGREDAAKGAFAVRDRLRRAS